MYIFTYCWDNVNISLIKVQNNSHFNDRNTFNINVFGVRINATITILSAISMTFYEFLLVNLPNHSHPLLSNAFTSRTFPRNVFFKRLNLVTCLQHRLSIMGPEFFPIVTNKKKNSGSPVLSNEPAQNL